MTMQFFFYGVASCLILSVLMVAWLNTVQDKVRESNYNVRCDIETSKALDVVERDF